MRDGFDGLPPRSRGLEGRHVLFALLGFFGIVFVVNATFLFKALSTYSGVVSNEPYRKGLAYNERIAADERQSQLGWRDEISVARDGAILVVLKDAERTPVGGLSITANVGRPTTAQFDRPTALVEGAPGIYAARAGALDEGAWIVAVEARQAGASEPVYRARKRIWLNP